MAYEQNITFYINKFREFPWKVFESEHYIFHVEPGSLAEREIEQIKARQEAAYEKIIGTLELSSPEQKILYYFYPSRALKKELMGDDWYGQSIYSEFTIHAVYNENDKVVGEHEDTHLLSLPLGLPISLFQEGLAELMVGKSMFGRNHEEVVREGIKNGLSLSLPHLMSQQGWLDTPDEHAEFYYAVAGVFVSKLLEKLGLQQFKKLYSGMSRDNSAAQNIEIFEALAGKLEQFAP